MKKFENPELEVEKIDLVDVITTSECTEDCDGYEVCKREF